MDEGDDKRCSNIFGATAVHGDLRRVKYNAEMAEVSSASQSEDRRDTPGEWQS